MKTEIKIEANQETTQNAANLSFQSSIGDSNPGFSDPNSKGSVRMERQISLKLPLFDASNFEILKAFQPSKTLCKQSQLIQIIEEVRSPKINKSLHGSSIPLQGRGAGGGLNTGKLAGATG